jgi:acyl-CoA reductase-like NAD-dependent aldehyde dehydrogenase
MASGKVDVFAFIGTHKAASDLKKLHPRPHRLRAALGLDAKNPGIVLPQVDLDNAVEEAVTGALSFNGQRCTALKILFVHEDVVERLPRQVPAQTALKPGMPWEPGVALTPLPELARSTTSMAWLPMRRKRRARAQRKWRAQPRLVLLPACCTRSARKCACTTRSSSARWCRWCPTATCRP